jgi:hypothetical protein
MPPLVHDLRVHRSTHPCLHMLTLGLAHPTKNTHQHLVRGVARIELAAQLRHPELHAVRGEFRRDQRELITEPAPRALTDYHGAPHTIRPLQLDE